MKNVLPWMSLAICICFGFGARAEAQMVIESLDGPVTQYEIDTFKAFMRGRPPLTNNFGNQLAHHTSGQQLDALGLMYEVSRDQEILDIFVNWADNALAGRNDPDTGCIAWTGNRELFWPIGINPNATCVASTDGEQGYVMSHILFCAKVILQNPSIWNNAPAIGDQLGFGATYLQRAHTHVQECDRTEDTFILPWFITNNQWRFPAQSTGYDGSTWFGLPFPWNQQWMLNQALIRLVDCHLILGDDPNRVANYENIVRSSWSFWQGSDLSQVTFQGRPAYTWHYVDQSAPNHAIEDTGHAQFDMWGLWLAVFSGRYGIDDTTMTTFANTTRYGIYAGNGIFNQRIDGTSTNTQANLQPQYFFLAKWIPDLYTIIGNADLPNAANTAIYDAGILWTKNVRYNGWPGTQDFSLSASPSSQTVTVGGETSHTATVTSSGAFGNTVRFSVSGLPSGATASFNPTSLSGGLGSSTLNVSTDGSALAGTYARTIAGACGNLVHNTTVALTINPVVTGDFSVSATPSSQTVAAGDTASYIATVASMNGFGDSVALGTSGLPTGTAASFNPASIGGGSGSSTLSVSTSSSTPADTYTLTITGTGPSRSHATTVTLVVTPSSGQQRLLNADGQTDTYTLINHVLGGTAEEVPDCSHADFGPHITQAWDDHLGKYVFVFHMHVTPDNDRCVAFDRQRNEIKTYGPSPDYLKGFLGDTVTFRWRFRLDGGFQPSPSFTHIHQIKAGDGDSAAPIITLTARSGSPDILQVIHTDSTGLSRTLMQTDLTPFKESWVEAYEQLTYGSDGTYSIQITSVSDGSVLLSYSNSDIDLWRTNTTFVRPKWGIYRSLKNQNYLRDEQVRYGGFCLAKGSDDCPPAP